MTGKELIAALQRIPEADQDLPVEYEGVGSVGHVEVDVDTDSGERLIVLVS